MANNRARLACLVCGSVCPMPILKYYPSTGWYVNRAGEYPLARVNEWLEEHGHEESGAPDGPRHFALRYEADVE